jgi:hypothetical protein
MAVSDLLNQTLGVRPRIAIGDTVTITVALYQDGAAWAPTVTAAEFNLKENIDDADADALITKSLGSGVTVSGSTATVTIASANWATAGITESGTYYWALKIEESGPIVTTVAAGTMLVKRTAVLARG